MASNDAAGSRGQTLTGDPGGTATLANFNSSTKSEKGRPWQLWEPFVRPTIQLRVLYVLVVLAHDRRRILHFNVTEHPTALWAAQQMVEAFPENTAPRYMVRDRDGIYGEHFRWGVEEMGIEEIRIAPKSPWQNCLAGDR
jgi:hypothetical protein